MTNTLVKKSPSGVQRSPKEAAACPQLKLQGPEEAISLLDSQAWVETQLPREIRSRPSFWSAFVLFPLVTFEISFWVIRGFHQTTSSRSVTETFYLWVEKAGCHPKPTVPTKIFHRTSEALFTHNSSPACSRRQCPILRLRPQSEELGNSESKPKVWP